MTNYHVAQAVAVVVASFGSTVGLITLAVLIFDLLSARRNRK